MLVARIIVLAGVSPRPAMARGAIALGVTAALTACPSAPIVAPAAPVAASDPAATPGGAEVTAEVEAAFSNVAGTPADARPFRSPFRSTSAHGRQGGSECQLMASAPRRHLLVCVADGLAAGTYPLGAEGEPGTARVSYLETGGGTGYWDSTAGSLRVELSGSAVAFRVTGAVMAPALGVKGNRAVGEFTLNVQGRIENVEGP